MDAEKIRDRMTATGFDMTRMAEGIGINRTTLWRKLTGKLAFTVPEAQSMCRLLKIEDPRDYFFDR